MDMDKFKKDMTIFAFGQHQDFLTYYQMLMEFGYSFEDVKTYVKITQEELVKTLRKPIVSIAKICPLCSKQLRLLPVNFNPATITKEDSQSVWICLNKKCMNTIYNKESIAEITKKGGT